MRRLRKDLTINIMARSLVHTRICDIGDCLAAVGSKNGLFTLEPEKPHLY
jgi:hypothetical protein